MDVGVYVETRIAEIEKLYTENIQNMQHKYVESLMELVSVVELLVFNLQDAANRARTSLGAVYE